MECYISLQNQLKTTGTLWTGANVTASVFPTPIIYIWSELCMCFVGLYSCVQEIQIRIYSMAQANASGCVFRGDSCEFLLSIWIRFQMNVWLAWCCNNISPAGTELLFTATSFHVYTTVTDFLVRIFAAQLHVPVLRSKFNWAAALARPCNVITICNGNEWQQ